MYIIIPLTIIIIPFNYNIIYLVIVILFPILL